MKYNVTCKIIYNGNVDVEANSYEEAMAKANNALKNGNSNAPYDIKAGSVDFTFEGCTAYGADLHEDSKEELDDKISEVLDEFEEYDERDICEALTKLTGENTYLDDSGIDDGAEGEDDYVMYADFHIENIGNVKVYYGNNTLGMGLYDIDLL